jgi:hypothetical protein
MRLRILAALGALVIAFTGAVAGAGAVFSAEPPPMTHDNPGMTHD